MGTVGVGFSMSLDGFIAGPGDDEERLFAWYFSGETDVNVPMGDEEMELKLSEESAEQVEGAGQTVGAIVSGRRTFDVAGAWGGRHPMDVPVFVVTHTIPQEWAERESPFTFVTDGVESAVAQAKAIAGEKNVGVTGPDIMRQCIELGLLDEIGIDLVPVLLGDGIRLFDFPGGETVELERLSVVAAPGVTHLRFRVVK
jgi:dihydrofolate reductase